MTDTADGVLLIHAFPLDARMWRSQVEALHAAGWPVAAPSLPGFGGEPMAGDTLSMSAAADRCLQELDAEGIERAVVCGLSMGGYVAFELWRGARQRIAGLVLANTRAGADSPEAAAGRHATANRLRDEGNGWLAAEPPPLLGADAGETLWREVRGVIADQPAESIAAAAEGMAARVDSTPDLSSIDVPVLVLTSAGDTLIPASESLTMVPHLSRSDSVTLERAGHLSNLEAPEEFTGAVLGFLRGFDRP